jgi:hypothetical protein
MNSIKRSVEDGVIQFWCPLPAGHSVLINAYFDYKKIQFKLGIILKKDSSNLGDTTFWVSHIRNMYINWCQF